jgi:uncharacterized damage-inducible protein DinB
MGKEAVMQDALLAELAQEAASTRRVLERVPEQRLSWKPHPKSMSLGQLALHVATIPGGVSAILDADGFDAATADFSQKPAASREELLEALEANVAKARGFLERLDAKRAAAPWRLSRGGREIFTVPRGGAVRSILFNHWYHHRGQLSVYLRLLDVPVPAVYGNSADENPLA